MKRQSTLGDSTPPARRFRGSLRPGVQSVGIIERPLRGLHQTWPLNRARGPRHLGVFELPLNERELLSADVLADPVLTGCIEFPELASIGVEMIRRLSFRWLA